MRLCKYHCNLKLFCGLIPLVIIANTFLYVFLFSQPRAKIVSLTEIANNLVGVPINWTALNTSKVTLCNIMVVSSENVLHSPQRNVPDTVLEDLPKNWNIEPGGVWKPGKCQSRHHVALIVPYRNRESQLRDFLAYMHPFLQKQLIKYRIVIVEQSSRNNKPFNRAKLFNIGFAESQKIEDFHCYIFHDVDLIPENLNNIYGCTFLPRHMSSNINVHDYKLPYDQLFGGAIAILKDQFLAANGFSNTFFGWGGEDDDFYNRITRNGTRICRFSSDLSRYIMLPHKKEKPSDDRYYFLQSGFQRFSTDGLNSLKYTVLKIDFKSLYTHLIVDI